MLTKHSIIVECRHCYNKARMEIIGAIHDIDTYKDPEGNVFQDTGYIYQLLKCPACLQKSIARYFWYDQMESEEDLTTFQVIDPPYFRVPFGLPEHIQEKYEAAERIRKIEADAYVILMRKILELVCIDKEAKGNKLADKIDDLANRGIIPMNLVGVAKGIRIIGNLGAHTSGLKWSLKEMHFLKMLVDSILEYVYSAPQLANGAIQMLDHIKSKTNL